MDYAIESCVIDVARREVRQGDAAVAVEPKVFDLLLHLVEHHDRVVSKDELVAQIWQGRAISDTALSSCVKAARRAIGDDGRQQRLIRTIHRHGFRFVGPVVASDRPARVDRVADALVARDPARHSAQAVTPQAAESDLDLSLPAGPSIAVLPIRPLSGADPARLLADGFTHDLTVRLARTRWLFVTARASAARFQDDALDAVGERLGVRYAVSGSIMVVDRRLRLTIALTDTRRNCEIWAEHFDRTIEDIFALQSEIGDRVAAIVESEIERIERQRALLTPFASLNAWSAYHRARHHLYRYTAQDCEKAEQYLGIAARLDPHASRVFAALSFVHWQRAFLQIGSDRTGEIAESFACARHSVALDALEPQGHWALGRAFLLDGDTEAAVEELEAAVDLNPNFAIGQYSLAYALGFGSDSARGFDCVAKARRLSPCDPMTYAFLAVRATLHGVHGETEQAAEWSRRAVQHPYAHYHIQAIAAWCHQAAGKHEEARGYIARLRSVRPDYSRADYFKVFPFSADRRAVIDTAFAELGV